MSLWNHPTKVTVFDESSFSESRVFKGTPRGWLWMAIAGLCAVGGLTFVLVALTPLREVLVPGYVATSTRESMEATQALADSMEQVLQQNAQTVMAPSPPPFRRPRCAGLPLGKRVPHNRRKQPLDPGFRTGVRRARTG